MPPFEPVTPTKSNHKATPYPTPRSSRKARPQRPLIAEAQVKEEVDVVSGQSEHTPSSPSSDGGSVFDPASVGPEEEDVEMDKGSDDSDGDFEDADEKKGKQGKVGRGGKSRPSAASNPRSAPRRGGGGGGGGSGGKGKLWTPDEDWRLFQERYGKKSNVPWSTIADAVGRDSKSCQNRAALIDKRLESVIRGISSS